MLNAFYKNNYRDPTFPFAMPINEYKKFKIEIPELLELDLNIKKLEIKLNKLNIHVKEFFEFVCIKKNVEINIIPVNFGSTKSFMYKAPDKNTLELYFTWRYDLDTKNEAILSGLIASVITYLGNEAKDEFTLMNSQLDWYTRQNLIDFLCTKTKYGKLFCNNLEMFNTTNSLSKLNQFAYAVVESHKYLQELGFDCALAVNLKNNILTLDEQKVILTDIESKLVAYLLQSKNKICSFDNIYNHLWSEKADVSLYALSKHLSNIRKKIKETGYISELIYVARGNGVLFAA